MSRSLVPALALLGATLAFGVGAHATAERPCAGGYTVVRGDTLYSIARRCGSSVVAIAGASGLADPRRIEIGQRLIIPGGRARGTRGLPGLSYRMARGDTLFSLARWSRVGLGALLAANPGIDPRQIEIGDAVRLPAGAVPPESARLRERGPGSQPPRAEPPRRDPPRASPAEDRPEADDNEPDPEGM